jgi:hypothetical protein
MKPTRLRKKKDFLPTREGSLVGFPSNSSYGSKSFYISVYTGISPRISQLEVNDVSGLKPMFPGSESTILCYHEPLVNFTSSMAAPTCEPTCS